MKESAHPSPGTVTELYGKLNRLLEKDGVTLEDVQTLLQFPSIRHKAAEQIHAITASYRHDPELALAEAAFHGFNKTRQELLKLVGQVGGWDGMTACLKEGLISSSQEDMLTIIECKFAHWPATSDRELATLLSTSEGRIRTLYQNALGRIRSKARSKGLNF